MRQQNLLPYTPHYNPRFVYFFTPFFIAVYIVEWLVLQTIYVLNKEILQCLGLKSEVYNSDRFQIKSGYATITVLFSAGSQTQCTVFVL